MEEEEVERFFDEDTGRWKSVFESVGGVRTRVLVGCATLDTSVFAGPSTTCVMVSDQT